MKENLTKVKLKLTRPLLPLMPVQLLPAHPGIDLFLPLRKISRDEDIASIIGRQRWEADEQLGCVLSGNYRDETGKVTCREDDIKRFFNEYALGEAECLVREVLP